MNLARIEKILPQLRQHPARLEALVAELIHQGVLTTGEVEFNAVSTFARSYSRDVADADIVESPTGPLLRLATHREGLFDQLPYALFHRPEPYHPGQKLNNRLEESKAARERERRARDFFFPFEQEFFLCAVRTELNERRLTDGFASPLRRRLLLEIWPACSRVNSRKYPLLSYILPLSHRIAGDLKKMAICYRAVLGLPVEMGYVNHDPGPAARQPAQGTTDLRLGADFYLEGAPEAELPELAIRLGPLSAKRSEDFLPGKEDYELLQLLNDCFVPYEVNVRISYSFVPVNETFKLADDGGSASRLGLNSRLSPCA